MGAGMHSGARWHWSVNISFVPNDIYKKQYYVLSVAHLY
jgi:hypothetical protein